MQIKTKSEVISSLWVQKFRFFQKKISKSGHRGDAEFGTHDFDFFLFFQNLDAISFLVILPRLFVAIIRSDVFLNYPK
jgi:hypothetical protein